MREVDERFLVVIRLNERSDLSITTSAAHALAILSGETLFAAQSVTVFDSNGKRVGKQKLSRAAKKTDVADR